MQQNSSFCAKFSEALLQMRDYNSEVRVEEAQLKKCQLLKLRDAACSFYVSTATDDNKNKEVNFSLLPEVG